MAIITVFYITPVLLWFYSILRNIHKSVIIQLIIDQFIFSPVFTASIIGLRMYLFGVDVNTIPGKVLEILPSAQMSAWFFWIPQRFISLSYIPIPLQLLFSNLCSFIWNIIFSIILSG
jgi:hypothetical protein